MPPKKKNNKNGNGSRDIRSYFPVVYNINKTVQIVSDNSINIDKKIEIKREYPKDLPELEPFSDDEILIYDSIYLL